MPRRLKKAFIKYISLVPKGANKLPVIYKEDGNYEFNTVIKQSDNFDELGELTAIVYAPEKIDSQGDIASANVIKEMAYSFSKDGNGVDMRHDGKVLSKDKAYVAESFIVQKGDARFDGMQDYAGEDVDVTGGWAVVIKIDDPSLRTLFKNGEWDGVSMAGTAQVEQEKEEVLTLKSMAAAIKNLFTSKEDDTDMDKKELQEALEASNKALAAEIVKALAPKEEIIEVDMKDPVAVQKHLDSLKPKDEPKDDTPEFKGDILKSEDVKAHALALKIHVLKKATDMKDPEAILKLHDAIKKLQAEDSPEDADDVEDEDFLSKDDELAALRHQVNQMSRKSAGYKSDNPIADILKLKDGFTKEDRAAFKVGGEISKIANAM